MFAILLDKSPQIGNKVTRSEQQTHESSAWEGLHAGGTAAFVTLLLTVLQEHLLETHASFH